MAQQLVVGLGQLIDNPVNDQSVFALKKKTVINCQGRVRLWCLYDGRAHILILYSFVGRLEQSSADLHFGKKFVHSNGSGKERNKSLNRAAVTSTGTFSRQTSSQTSIFSRSSRTNLAFADFLNIPCVNGPLENI